MTTTLTQNDDEPQTLPVQRVLPLTESQRGFWTQAALGGEAARAFHVAHTLELRGPYDHTAMLGALRAVAARHEALRTSFGAEGESQVIAPEWTLDVPLIDLSQLPSAERQAEAVRLLEHSAGQAFEAGDGPWFRATIVKLETERHVLTLTGHHALIDGPSYRVVLEELCTLYGGDGKLADPMQLSEFVRRQPALERADDEAFWLAQFAEAPPHLDLPLDRPRPPFRSFVGGQVVGELDSATCRALQGVAAARGCTLYAVLFGAFSALLSRLSGQEDIVLGATFGSGIRREQGGAGLVANTVNVLPLRNRTPLATPFDEQLRRVQTLLTAAAAHKEYFFGRLLERLSLPRDPAFHPLFSALFNFYFYGGGFRRRAGALEVELVRGAYPYSAPNDTAMFELVLDVVRQSDGGLEIRCDYAAALFDRGTIQRWLGYYQRLLEGIVAAPTAWLSELPLLGKAEREQLLAGWNDTGREYPWAQGPLHELIEAQAERTPEAIAVSFEGQRLTYQMLNARANRLAHCLRDQGVGPDALVAVLADRSLELIIGLLAVLKAGGAYLPLDPGQPGPRRALMLQDAKPVTVLVQRALLDLVPVGNVLILEDDPVTAPSHNPAGIAGPDNLAYVIYTSGSTGVPKGVMNTHAGICNFVCWLKEAFQLGPSDCILQKTAFTFDVSLAEIFGALTTGARLVMAPPGLHGDTNYLAEAVALEGVTALWFVTPVLAAFLQEPALGRCGSLRHVTTGGEPLTLDVIDHFSRVLPHARLHNFYGPTETVVAVTAWACQPGAESISVPIGRPIANTQAYILDRALQPVPVGVSGELHIGGIQVGRGYLNRSELTAEKFIPNPFGEGRLYKTGDLCRYRSDGAIEFLGRLDHQVKLRGFRIELGEIETVLQQHPGIRECVVVARQDVSGTSKSLVAYVVGEGRTPEVLREHARAALPAYMIPAAFVFLDRLPLTANGKVDRRALPEPEGMVGKATVPPRNGTETKLTEIWEKVLAVHPIGVTDNFFELGGSSLTATRVFLEVRRVFGSHLPLALLFQAPTIEQLAQRLAALDPEQEWAHVVAIQSQGNRPPFFGVHGVHGNVLFYRQVVQLLGQEQPFYGVQSQGLDGKAITHTSVEAIAEYYIKNIRKIQPHGPYLLGGYSLGGIIAYEIARQLHLAEEKVPLLVLFDARNPARPPRLVSYRERLRKAMRDPASLFTVDRMFRILAGRIRGKAGDQFLKWNDLYQRTKSRFAIKPNRNEADDLLDLQIQMAYTRAVLAYRPLPFPGKLTLFRTFAPEPGYEDRPYLGWDSMAEGGIAEHGFAGEHLELLSEGNAPAIAKALNDCIQSALASVKQPLIPRPDGVQREREESLCLPKLPQASLSKKRKVRIPKFIQAKGPGLD